jgi:cation transport regulator ChaC
LLCRACSTNPRSRCARGPSGANAEYLFRLADTLRTLGAEDAHVFALEAAVRERLRR